MSSALPIRISPSVLIWARMSMGYTIDDAADKLHLKREKIESWENGIASPTYSQLENLAYKVYKRPLALFFRKEPPQEDPIEKDFRNVTSSEISHLSTEMRLVLRRAKRMQNIVRELSKNDEIEPLFKKFEVTLNDNPVLSANKFREFIGLSIEEQKKWNSGNAFENFKEYVERIGIYVFQLQMPFVEARAFSLTDDIPIIVLNTEDAKNGRIFSLFHEVCHILFNIGGIFRDNENNTLKKEYKAVEDFCNLFAASFLIPEKLFKKDIEFEKQKLHEWSEEDLKKFSSLYSVSKEVVLRKLVDLKLASQSFYFTKIRHWNDEFKRLKDERNTKMKESGKGGAEASDSRVVRESGKPYIKKVLEGYDKGQLTYADISEYLNVKLDYLPKIIDRIIK